MSRLLWWLSLVSLFVSSLVASRRVTAQAQPPKPRTQPARTQAQPATKQAPPAAAQTPPANAPAQPTGAQTPPAGAQVQPTGAPTPPASAQPQPAANAQPPQISGVNIFQTAPTPQGQATFYLEITGQNLPTTNPVVFIAPQQGLAGHTEVVSTTATTAVVKFTASKGYFPSSVAVAGTGGASNTFDVPKSANPNSNLPRIDDIEVLQLNRKNGTGSIKIDGANFGNDPSKISVTIVPREPDLSAFASVGPPPNPYACPDYKPGQEATAPTVRSAKDDIVVVDFSFFCQSGYAVPFVIARVVLTVPDKDGHQVSASYEMQPTRDKNLTYRSTILSQKQASSRFGGGIAQNFYAVQLSIVNSGAVKVQVPLASIRAEVEWFTGSIEGKKYYWEGPATVAPVPLTGAVSYFSTHRQATGTRAIVFNTLQGLTTIGSAVQFFFGHGFAQGVAIAGGGFRQGLGQIFQDLSDQQLANLTSQSFESIETVSGNGGSIEKVIFIQRGEEVLPSAKWLGNKTKFRRLINNIVGFEITGYEVPETAAKSATPQS